MADKIVVLRGTVDWAKVTGAPRPHTGLKKYDKGPFWSVDLTPDAKSLEIIKAAGLEEKLRDPTKSSYDKETRKVPYVSFKHLALKKDGTKNKPPAIEDIRGTKWDDDILIGNGSVVDIMAKVVDYGSDSEKGMYFQKMRVLELNSYEARAFEPVSEDDEFFANSTPDAPAFPPVGDINDAKAAPVIDDLDDSDVPF